MHSAQKPNLDDLPPARQLWRSTAIAAGVAAALLVPVVWPSEYGIDPTGIGSVLGLAEMGEIKSQLAEEAEADRLLMETEAEPQSSLQPGLMDVIIGAVVGTAHAQEPTAVASEWKDEITFALDPGQGIEIKLVMEEGAVARSNGRSKAARSTSTCTAMGRAMRSAMKRAGLWPKQLAN